MREQISLWQYFVLMTAFTIGTTIIVGAGQEAKQDLWIAEIIAISTGVLLFLFYYFISRMAGGKGLYGIIDFVFGKKIGKLIAYSYLLYFSYLALRVLRDFCELIVTTILPKTPIEIISIFMTVIIAYVLFHGLEVFARTTEIFIPYFFILIIGLGVLLLLTGVLEFKKMLPIFSEGFAPILEAVYPTMIVFPYGELVAFLVFIGLTTNFKYVGKVSVAAILLSGLLITYAEMLQILALGVDIRNRANFPLLVAAREVELLEFIERVDIFIVFILLIGIFVKIGVFFYAALKGAEYVFNKPYRTFLLPFSLVLPLFSILIAENIVEHYEEGLEIVPYFFHLPFQFGIPLFLFLVLFVKNRMKSQKGKGLSA
ncbi:endospore germination permease [Alkalihalobacillus sp. LMS39]|uniref:GerAB/ArcD/ProY family transporter n=1 Tax=Alkalihalobacillus sp. LMS39 TaxID=2924032 RepID=UPI001FB3E0E1|nr:endospore germination permease [Alkalihalobacillus sp. LMS39]UOE96254.1 spore germination protein [Alkalihalobacillus sp. LMS39]